MNYEDFPILSIHDLFAQIPDAIFGKPAGTKVTLPNTRRYRCPGCCQLQYNAELTASYSPATGVTFHGDVLCFKCAAVYDGCQRGITGKSAPPADSDYYIANRAKKPPVPQ